jgi:hypothetical protein
MATGDHPDDVSFKKWVEPHLTSVQAFAAVLLGKLHLTLKFEVLAVAVADDLDNPDAIRVLGGDLEISSPSQIATDVQRVLDEWAQEDDPDDVDTPGWALRHVIDTAATAHDNAHNTRTILSEPWHAPQSATTIITLVRFAGHRATRMDGPLARFGLLRASMGVVLDWQTCARPWHPNC